MARGLFYWRHDIYQPVETPIYAPVPSSNFFARVSERLMQDGVPVQRLGWDVWWSAYEA
jgi:hypothetical protein